ncbi:MAG: gno [Acidimicrobiales bacterium]|nr:gno [Acidimicrobiales bacterium]
MRRFGGRRALVTGASRGIGAAVAERLAAEGAAVAIVARTVDRHATLEGSLNQTAATLATYGTTVAVVAADLTDPESRSDVVARSSEALGGPIDILVNNAAAAMYAPIATYPEKRRRITFEVNLHAPFELAQQALPDMLAAGEGWIVNVSSATAKHETGPPFRPSITGASTGMYGASKAALNRLTNALAHDVYGTGVRVNTVEPRAAVMSEGALALIGDKVTDDMIESMEAMVEATVALCCCPADRTGKVHVSLDLNAELGLTVMKLDASGPVS